MKGTSTSSVTVKTNFIETGRCSKDYGKSYWTLSCTSELLKTFQVFFIVWQTTNRNILDLKNRMRPCMSLSKYKLKLITFKTSF